MSRDWIGVDLDRSLAVYEGHYVPDQIGEPIPLMAARVKAWLAAGRSVKLVTARANPRCKHRDAFMKAWIPWSLKHIGVILPVTNEKDYRMEVLWDDRAVGLVPNTGERADGLEVVAALLEYAENCGLTGRPDDAIRRARELLKEGTNS